MNALLDGRTDRGRAILSGRDGQGGIWGRDGEWLIPTLRRGESRRCVGDVLGAGDCGSDCVLRCYTCLGHGIITRIKILAILGDFGEHILVGGEFAVETEELLLFFSHGA